MSFAVRTFQGALWQAAGNWLQVALNLASVAIIARWVGPESYGLIGAALLVTGFVRMIAEGALVECVIQRPDLNDGHTDATFACAMSVASVGLAFLVWQAELFAAWAGVPQAADGLRIAALLLPLFAAQAVPMALITRELRFGEKTRIDTLGAVLANGAGIAAALSGAGLWSLLLMEAVRAVVPHTMCWRAIGWRPRLRCRRQHLRELGNFNAWVTATYLLGHLDHLLPRALIAHWLGASALGFYLLASRVFDELLRLVTGPLAGITMPIVARLQQDREQAQRLILGLYQASVLLVLPVFAGFIAVAPLAVPVLFGASWLPAVPAIQMLMLAAPRSASAVFNISILRGFGRADLPLLLLGFGCVLHLALIPPLAQFGILGVMGALVLRQFIAWPLSISMIRRVTGLSAARQIDGYLPVMAAAAAMAAVVHVWVQSEPWPQQPLATLAGAVALGATLYAGLLALLVPPLVRRVLAIARAAIRRDRTALAVSLGDTG